MTTKSKPIVVEKVTFLGEFKIDDYLMRKARIVLDKIK